MDFISNLPKSDGFGSILVVFDRFNKYATFIVVLTDYIVEEAAKLFLCIVLGATGREIELYPNTTTDETFGNLTHENGTKDDSNQHFHGQEWHHSNSPKNNYEKDEVEDEDEIRRGELSPSVQEMELLENQPQQENHSALWLCKDLFPGDEKSVWNGPHSLNRRYSSARQNNPIRSALAALMQ
ncbi:uncharacterized protein LOC110020377 [Phalaenopsis equestris]|uniref:uncharacterized protein LOC110020377 n=1 Tax=Phalaenopsis equestris TaxID=78828 RepID=UPI0009E64F37|nr:uncharacterized protein LOC110020377 [Phalaenopsis equestris]